MKSAFCPLPDAVSPTGWPLEARVPPVSSVLKYCDIKAFGSQTWQLAAWERIPFEAWISLLQMFWQAESVVLRERVALQCLCEQTAFSNNSTLCVRLNHWNNRVVSPRWGSWHVNMPMIFYPTCAQRWKLTWIRVSPSSVSKEAESGRLVRWRKNCDAWSPPLPRAHLRGLLRPVQQPPGSPSPSHHKGLLSVTQWSFSPPLSGCPQTWMGGRSTSVLGHCDPLAACQCTR